MTALTGLMLDCDIAPICKFDRKNYFYPDMPKNYQISQYDQPICLNGGVPLHEFAYPKDAQKSIANPGTPIAPASVSPSTAAASEAATEQRRDCASRETSPAPRRHGVRPRADRARSCLEELRLTLRYLEVSDCEMQEGSLRCDANVNLHITKDGQTIATRSSKSRTSTVSGPWRKP
jgi:aspartyl-tRNA(Asn)/glutamyl-tRNA(Gln) amidotransferase subunit B